MKRLLTILAAAACLTAAAAPAFAQRGEQGVIDYREDDRAMNKAIEDARATLPNFWRAYEAKAGSDFMLKVEFPASRGGTEHIWVGEIHRDGAKLTGVLLNEPSFLPQWRRSSTVEFQIGQVSDWAYVKFNRLWGSYTTRVMLARMSEQEAAEMREFLSDTPVEPGI